MFSSRGVEKGELGSEALLFSRIWLLFSWWLAVSDTSEILCKLWIEVVDDVWLEVDFSFDLERGDLADRNEDLRNRKRRLSHEKILKT